MEVVGDPHLLILDRIMLKSLLTDLRGAELSLVVTTYYFSTITKISNVINSIYYLFTTPSSVTKIRNSVILSVLQTIALFSY